MTFSKRTRRRLRRRLVLGLALASLAAPTAAQAMLQPAGGGQLPRGVVSSTPEAY